VRRALLVTAVALAAVAGTTWLGVRAVRWAGASWAQHEEVTDLEPWSPGADLRATFDSLPGDAGTRARLRLLDDNPEAWVARWELLRIARERIDAASFIVRGDVYGLAFLGHLLHKAQTGVRIRLLVDAYGTSMGRSVFDEDYLDELVAAGVAIRIYRPFFSRLLQSAARIDPIALIASEHDKLLLVDRRWSLVGGRNVGHEYFTDPGSDPRAFLDVDVLADGAGAHADFERAFEAEWASEAAYPVADESLDLASRRRALLGAYRAMDAWLAGRDVPPEDADARAHLETLRREHGALQDALRERTTLPADEPELEVRILNSVPRSVDGRDAVSRGLARLVRSASREVLIQSPYLVLSRSAVALLVDAGRRGVDLTVLTNSPTSSDNALSQAFFLAQWPELLARVPGMELYVRGDRHNVHGKMAVFDDRVTVIATYNLDPVSMAVNGEAALVVWSEDLARRATTSILRPVADGPPSAFRYDVVRDAGGAVVRGPDGSPQIAFGPDDHDAADGNTSLAGWSLVLRAVRAVAPDSTLFWASQPAAALPAVAATGDAAPGRAPPSHDVRGESSAGGGHAIVDRANPSPLVGDPSRAVRAGRQRPAGGVGLAPSDREATLGPDKESAMNWDIIKGKWGEIKGEARKQWGKLTDDDWQEIGGEKDKLLGKLQQRYGWARDEAERRADDYFSSRA